MKAVRSIICSAAILLGVSAPSALGKKAQINIIPLPANLQVDKGSFNVRGAVINCDSSVDPETIEAISQFAGQLTLTTGRTATIASTAGLARTVMAGKAKGFAFFADRTLSGEQYRIKVNPKYIAVSAYSHEGFLYALQTLRQLMPVEVYGKSAAPGADWKIPCVTIEDKPLYRWRGMHLDCSRHFISIAEIKRYLDIMAIYKLNRFHWHLTDDQGWRIELKCYPELTQTGAYRDGSQYGHNQSEVDNIRHGGYYTQDQIREVIAYAAKRGIMVVPEVDLPGHMQAVLATYPHLGCTGGPYEVRKIWGVAEDVLCGGKAASYEFLKNVLEEVADLFPGPYFHIGGDECPKLRWEQCPDCQAKIKELGLKGRSDRKNAGPEWELQSYITTFVSDVLAAKGKQIIGWDEIRYGGTKGSEIIMSWLGMKMARAAVEDGLQIIACPMNFCYYNFYQVKPYDSQPIAFRGYVPLRKAYSLDPFAPESEKKAENYIPEQYRDKVLGVQANLWGEYITSDKSLEYQLLPRVMAISEVGWSDPARKDYEDFRRRIIAHQLPILDILGYNYCKDVLEK